MISHFPAMRSFVLSVGLLLFPISARPQPSFRATYLRGSGAEGGAGNVSWLDIAVADNRDLIVAGMTASTDLPTTTGSFGEDYGRGPGDIFVGRLGTGLALVLGRACSSGSGDKRPCNNSVPTKCLTQL